MKNLLVLPVLLTLLAFVPIRDAFLIENHIWLEISTYEKDGQTKAAVMPFIDSNSVIWPYQRRFSYVLLNKSKIHQPENFNKRMEIWDLYPDTLELKKEYLLEFSTDDSLINYMGEMHDAIFDAGYKKKTVYSEDEMMEVASKFFYADKVFPDTTIQTHICIGLNGVAEAKWKKDYTFLEAFCFEAIFDDFNKKESRLDVHFDEVKDEVIRQLKSDDLELELYLLEVRKELFVNMKNDTVLREVLKGYYSNNESNLAFRIEG